VILVVMNKHDEQEFSAFCNSHWRQLLVFLRGMGLASRDADEALNDCFLAIWKYWHRISGSNPRAYLYKVARTQVYRRWDAGRRDLEDLMSEPPATTTGDFAQQVVDRQAVRWALLQLTEREREAVLLRYYVGCDVAETATIMDGITPGAVTRYASDGRQKLNRALGSETRDRKGGS
jgi:RNA polymerase sigma factor (sigma-70 family)